MSRLRKYLAAATLLALPIIAACGEDVMPPPPTGDIVGQVSIEGMGVDGVSVSLSNGASTATAGGGNYRFERVEQGSYTVTISGFPADASFDATSAPASIGDTGGTVTVDFRGTYIRTAAIMGTVTVENMGLGGVTVRLSGMGDGQTTTDDSGQYSFTGLRAGTYSVEISSFDSNEVSFSSTSGAATVGVGESKVVSFDGTYLRTAGIQGQVSVDGEGLQGVTVTLVGEGEDRTEVTNASGQYAFSQLKSGTYQVAITNPDPDDYEFATTSKSATVATGETANVPFEGTLLRTAGIAGRVSVEGMGLDGVTVTLAGAAEATAETANGGQYSFAGLAAGTYVLSIANPDEVAYSFAEDQLQRTVMLADDQSAIVNFSGTHTRTASVSGMLYLDEAPQDKMYTANEPPLAHAGIPILLQGPGINDVTAGVTGDDGGFAFEGLVAGNYRVLVNLTDEVAAMVAGAGFAFVGDLTGAVVNVAAGMAAQVNFPFRITTQTLVAGAVMGNADATGAPVAGVELALYANADMTGMLGEATTDDTGMATFNFARADNTGPSGNDNIVFVKVDATGHDALVVSENDFTEVTYAGTARVSNAPAAVKLVNVAVAFDFWVKSNETARDGDMGLGGWHTQVYMGDPKADDAMPLMKDDANATMPTNDGEKNMADLGKSTFSYTVDPAMLPATFTVMAAEDGQPDMGEAWEQGDALMHTHTGLDLPPGADDDMLDLGPLRVTFTTQAIYVGVHRELDDRTGYTDYIGIGAGDGRPGKTAQGEITITLMTADDRGRLRAFEYDADADPTTPDTRAEAAVGATGMVSFKKIPAGTEFTVVAEESNDLMIIPDSRATREIDAFGAQLDDYPDGVIVGAFGGGSGARPDVWLCPLQRQQSDDPNEVCSTYAYKWATGTISGTISNLRKGDKATVTLTPVNSNDDYADDLEDDVTVTAGNSGSAKYTFTGVADGRYRAALVAKAGSWRTDATDVLSVMHDEKNEAEDYAGDSAEGDLSATDLRGGIRGRIANDSNGRRGLTGDESRAGVEVAIYTAKKVGGTGDTKDNYVADKAVTDSNGDPVTAETNRDGVFMFEGLTEGAKYFLKPQGTDLYTAVRNGNPDIGKAAEMATDIVSHALVTAGELAPNADPGTPMWNYHTSTATPNGDANFVLLYMDGEVEGTVTDKGVRAAHSRTVIELRQCLKTDFELDTDTATAGNQTQEASQCNGYTDVEVQASVDTKGNWSADGLMEGYYEVVPDLPAGYEIVDQNGISNPDSSTYHTQQIVGLEGGRADETTSTFYIKDRNAGTGADFTSLTIDGTSCTPAQADGEIGRCADQNNAHDDGVISVRVAASDGAEIHLSSSETEPNPSGTGTYSHPVPNGESANISLPNGLRTFYIHIAAEDGYANNRTNADGTARAVERFSVRRDADVRLQSIKLEWIGGALTLDRGDLDLNTDGEDDPVTGIVGLDEIVVTGLPAGQSAVTVTVGPRTGFASTSVATTACSATRTAPTAASPAPASVTLADHDSNPATPDQLTICISIGDWKSDADKNDANGHQYQAILKRPS